MNQVVTTDQDQQDHINTNRRHFLKTATAAGLGLAGATLTTATDSLAQDSPTISTDPGARMMTPSNAKEFGMAVIGRAELSLAASKIAVERASRRMPRSLRDLN